MTNEKQAPAGELTDGQIDALLVLHGKGDDGFHSFARGAIAADRALQASRVAELEAQLDAVGAGGVGAMVPKHTHPQAKEREAYIAYLTTTFPNTYSEDDAQRWWAQEHISALAWDARSALAPPQPQQIAEPASQFDAGYFYNLIMHTLMDVGAPGCKYRLECMADELRVLMQATPKEPS